MTEPQIRITVDGKLAVTTAQAAARYDRTVNAIRNLISRYRITPVAHLDSRTPLYAAVALDKTIKELPGKGANLRAAAAG